MLWNNLIQQKINRFTAHLFQKRTKSLNFITHQRRPIKIIKTKHPNHSFSSSLQNISELYKKKYSKDSRIIKRNLNFKGKLNKSQLKLKRSNRQLITFNQCLISIKFRNSCFKKSNNKENSHLMFFKGLKPMNVKESKEKLNANF